MQKTNFLFEIIIHDDASTDGTTEIIKEYEVKYPQIIKPICQTVNQYSKGVKPTWKFNAPRWKGKYIAICEGDDYWTDPYKLQKQVDFLEANEEYTGCASNATKIFGTWDEKRNVPYKDKVLKTDLTTEDLIGERHFHTATFVFRNFQINPESFKNVHSGDRLLNLLVSLNGKIKVLEDKTAVYRLENGGVSSSASSRNLRKDMSIPKLLKPHVEKQVYIKMREFVLSTIFSYTHKIYLSDFIKYGFICLWDGIKYSQKGLSWKLYELKKRLRFLKKYTNKIAVN
jgi:glycosyltransferase involved in cell wall biosynthesis